MTAMKFPRLGALWVAIAFGTFSFSAFALTDTVRLQWDASPDSSVTEYRVYSASSSTDSFSPVLNTREPAASVSVPGSLAGYRFRITALNAAGAESDPSNDVGVGPQLHHQVYGDILALSWSGEGFTLQSAPAIKGPWSNRSTTSPTSIQRGSTPQFFRLMRN
jgi:hypothetical protein